MAFLTRTTPTVWILAVPLVDSVLPWALALYPGAHGSSPQWLTRPVTLSTSLYTAHRMKSYSCNNFSTDLPCSHLGQLNYSAITTPPLVSLRTMSGIPTPNTLESNITSHANVSWLATSLSLALALKTTSQTYLRNLWPAQTFTALAIISAYESLALREEECSSLLFRSDNFRTCFSRFLLLASHVSLFIISHSYYDFITLCFTSSTIVSESRRSVKMRS